MKVSEYKLSKHQVSHIMERTSCIQWHDYVWFVLDKHVDFFFWCLTPLSAIPWRPVLVVEEAGVHGENHRPWASNW